MSKFKTFLVITGLVAFLLILYPFLVLMIILVPQSFKKILRKAKDTILLLNWLYTNY